jgi:hypothetical protein
MTMPLPDPQQQARLWEFITDVRAGIAEPGPYDFEFACELTGLWEVFMARFYALVRDLSPADAEAAVGELIEGQRILCGSLAASSE